MALPWFGDDIHAAVISGTGGYINQTIVVRDDIIDFAALLANLGDFEADEEVRTLHPLLGLVQTVAEPTEPLNYAPFFYRKTADSTRPPTASLLVTSGIEDQQTDFRTSIALAAAAGLPSLGPRATEMPALDLRGFPDSSPDLEGNVSNADGTLLTGGFLQRDSFGHFLVFQDPATRAIYSTFLAEAFEGPAPLSTQP